MATKDTIMKYLTDRRLIMFDESEFVMNTNKKPMDGGVSCTFFACRAKEPDVGSQVSIKIVKQPISYYLRPQSETDYAEERLWQYFRRECCISKRNESHPNILKCLGVVNRFGGSVLPGIVSKDVAVGNLKDFVLQDRRATITTKIQLMRDVANSLAFLHERMVIHRNLRCNKIYVDIQDGKLIALLGDFSCAKDFDDLLPEEDFLPTRSMILTMAPECLQNRNNHKDDFDNGAGDMWSFGCTMVEVLARTVTEHAWPGYGGMASEALECGQRPPRLATFPPWDEAWNFIHDRCWELDPSKRITAREAVVELEELLKSAPS